MWFLNFCSPFLFNPGTENDTFRLIMYIEIGLCIVLYLIFYFLYSCCGQSTSKGQGEDLYQFDGQSFIKIRFVNNSHNKFISFKKFKQWYLAIFGMHSVCVASSIFYSPYVVQFVVTILYFILLVVISALYQIRAEDRKILEIIYKILTFLSYLCNIILLFSGCMGVGASGYDETAKICLLQSGIAEL